MAKRSEDADGGNSPIEPQPDAVVVDTNLWGKGTLDAARLKAHAERLARSSIEVWVPTQVLLEWASHIASDVDQAAPIWKRLRRAGVVTGDFPATSDVQHCIDAVKVQLDAIPNLKILPMTADAAIQGLHDQILGTGPGGSRSGVKTGGVDSSWVRDALAAVSNDPSRLVFLTDNAKDVHATAREMNLGKVQVRTEHHLYSALFGSAKAPQDVVRMVTAYLDTIAADPGAAVGAGGSPAEPLIPGADIGLATSAFDYPPEVEVSDVALLPGATVIGIAGVDVSNDSTGAEPYSYTVEFRLLLLADADITGYQLDQNGQVVMQSAAIADVVISAPFVADVVDLHTVVEGAGPALATGAEPRFDEASEALEWVFATLTDLYGVQLVNDDLSLEEFVFVGPDGVTVTAALEGSAYEEWTLTFGLGDREASMSSHYDPSVRVWAGKDSFNMRDPYYLAGDESGYPTSRGLYLAIRAIWRFLNGMRP